MLLPKVHFYFWLSIAGEEMVLTAVVPTDATDTLWNAAGGGGGGAVD